MEHIISINRLKELRDIGTSMRDAKLKDCIMKAQYIDLRGALGSFVGFLEDNKDKDEYKYIFKGWGSKNTFHLGIDYLLATYAYIRYLAHINVNNTSFGAVRKMGQDSQPISREEIRDIVVQEKRDSDVVLQDIIRYIEQDEKLSPHYTRDCNSTKQNKTFSSNIYKL